MAKIIFAFNIIAIAAVAIASPSNIAGTIALA
jgi:hypothetical protein